ncbi:MAG: lysophospholipid acyltransferase family protein [Spirochaetales bacterium]|nr:lysophospholipid acyltransferase family protein [Spirochaetales bacterium]
MKKNFSHFWLVNDVPQTNDDIPLVMTPNHMSWWDGFIIYCFLKLRTRRKFRIMMLEQQLLQFPFFSKLGAFSIDPGKPKSVHQTILYFHSLLKDSKNCIVFYPQGKMEPYWKRPQSIQAGLTHFLNSPVISQVLPVASVITTYNEKKPEIIVRFGEVISSKEIVADRELFIKKYHDNLLLCDAAINNRDFLLDFRLEL